MSDPIESVRERREIILKGTIEGYQEGRHKPFVSLTPGERDAIFKHIDKLQAENERLRTDWCGDHKLNENAIQGPSEEMESLAQSVSKMPLDVTRSGE